MSEVGKRFTAALLAVVVLGAAAIAAAGDEKHENGWSGHEHGPGSDAMFGAGFFGADIARMGDQLGLSAEQRQSIKGIFDAARPQMQAMRESMRVQADKLRGTQPDDPNYATVVAQVSQSAAELASKMVTDGSQLRSQVYGLLNKEQKAKLPQIEAQMREQHFQRHRPPAAAPSSGDSSKPST